MKDHYKEYKKEGTICGYTIDEIDGNEDLHWGIFLRLKDCLGHATLQDKVAIEIDALLGYNNVEHVPEEEVMARAKEIVKLVRG